MARKAVNPGVGTGHGIRPRKELVCRDCASTYMAARSDSFRCPPCRKINELKRGREYGKHGGNCAQCGVLIHADSSLCRKCAAIKRNADYGPTNYKGGRVKAGEYIAIRLQRGKAKYTLEHIAVWEAVNGPLPQGWNIHHLNGIKKDNRLENLYGVSNSDHHRFASLERSIFEARIRELEHQLGTTPTS